MTRLMSSAVRVCSLPSIAIPTSAPASSCSATPAGVERLNRGGDLGHALAEARAERAVVRLDPVGDELGLAVDEVELLDVQLGGDHLGEALDRRTLGVGGDHHGLAQRLAQLHLRLGAGRAAQLDRAADDLHARPRAASSIRRSSTSGKSQRWTESGQSAEGLLVRPDGEVGVDLVGKEGRERRQQRREGDQAVAQGGEGGLVAVPEAAAVEPQVPVGELLAVVGDHAGGRGAVEAVHLLADLGDRPLQAGERPAVELARGPLAAPARAPHLGEALRLEALGVRVQDPERVGVPEGEQEVADRVADGPDREAVAGPGLLGGEVVPAEGVGAVFARSRPRARPRCRGSSTSSGPRGRGSGRGRRRCGSSRCRRAAPTRRAACRTSRGSGRSPRR